MLSLRIGRHGIRQLNFSTSAALQRVKPVSCLVAGSQSFSSASLPIRINLLSTPLSQASRYYATEAPAPKPKAAATKTMKRKSTSTTKGKKKAATKKKPKKPKKVKKVGRKSKTRKPKKEVTPEEKQKLKLRELKAAALKPPHGLPSSAWSVLSSEMTKGSKELVTGVKEASAKYKNLVPEEKEHYNHIAHENKAKNDAAYKAWIKSHTPDQIRIANNARTQLRRLTGRSRHWSKLQDDRQVKRPATPRLLFNADRWASGDFNGMKITEVPQLLKREWDALPAQEKKSYEDTYKSAQTKYRQDRVSVYGTKAASTRKRASTA